MICFINYDDLTLGLTMASAAPPVPAVPPPQGSNLLPPSSEAKPLALSLLLSTSLAPPSPADLAASSWSISYNFLTLALTMALSLALTIARTPC